MNGPCETPLVELLERVPADARMSYEHSPTHHSMIPVGSLCHRAAEIIRNTRPEAVTDELIEALKVFARCPVRGKDGGRFVIAKALYEDEDGTPREAHWHLSDFEKARDALSKVSPLIVGPK